MSLPHRRRPLAPLRAALVVDAPPERVRGAVEAHRTWARASTACGLCLEPAEPAEPGEAGEPAEPGAGLRAARAGLRPRPARRSARFGVTVVPTPAGSLVTVEVAPGRRRPRRTVVLRAAETLLGIILLAATDPRTVVVAGVLVRDGAILVGRRTGPPELAGRWECPGGKVEPGESETTAVARELAEELGVVVAVGHRVGSDVALDGAGAGPLVLRAYRAELLAGDPSPSVHDEIRWVTGAEIDALPWLASDRPLIPALHQVLAEQAGGPAPYPTADRPVDPGADGPDRSG